MSYVATVQLGLDLRTKKDGSGYDVCVGRDPKVHLQVGNVSVAFDDRNIFRAEEGYSGCIVQVGAMTDDPVRLAGKSVLAGCSPAEKLLYALADDLGYSLSPNGQGLRGVCDDCGEDYDRDPDTDIGYCGYCAGRNE
jgi:hypothetical protein